MFYGIHCSLYHLYFVMILTFCYGGNSFGKLFPQKPDIKVFYHEPPSTLHDREELRISCSGFVLELSSFLTLRMTVPPNHLHTGKIYEWVVDASNELDPRMPSDYNDDHHPTVEHSVTKKTNDSKNERNINITVTMVVDTELEGSIVTCQSCKSPNSSLCSTRSSRRFVIKAVPQVPFLMSWEVTPSFKNLHKLLLEINCTAVVGEKGLLTWSIADEHNKYDLWTVDGVTGIPSPRLSTDAGVGISIGQTVLHKCPWHGPQLSSSVILDMNSFSRKVAIVCYSYNATSSDKFIGELDKLSSFKLLTAFDSSAKARLPKSIVILITCLALSLMSLTLMDLSKSRARTNLLQKGGEGSGDGDDEEAISTEDIEMSFPSAFSSQEMGERKASQNARGVTFPASVLKS